MKTVLRRLIANMKPGRLQGKAGSRDAREATDNLRYSAMVRVL